jgi:hypothetical protein
MSTPDANLADIENWKVLSSFLPDGWREQARSLGALRRARYIKDPDTVLRLLLIHLASGCSLAETAARASASGLAKISAVGVFKRLRAAEPWLRWLAQQMHATERPPLASIKRRLRAVDATVVCEPGSTGSDWKVHYAVNLANLECDYFELTAMRQSGETFRRFAVEPGDVMMGDRVYAAPPGVAHVVHAGGDVIARLNRQSLPLFDSKGIRIDLLPRMRRLRGYVPREFRARVKDPNGGWIEGRLIALRRSAEATKQARRRLESRAKRNQTTVSTQSLAFAQYLMIWTTLPPAISSIDILDTYRLRWQIELVFKRMKSIMGLGHLPKKDEGSAKAWLAGKLFVSLLVEKMIAYADSISPWGYDLDTKAKPLA